MKSGSLRHLITVEEPVDTQNATGEEVTSFVSRGKVWGSIEPLTGRERLQANQNLAQLDTRVRIRWSLMADAINAKWRLRHNGVIYNVAAPPANIGLRREEIEIMCSSGLNEG